MDLTIMEKHLGHSTFLPILRVENCPFEPQTGDTIQMPWRPDQKEEQRLYPNSVRLVRVLRREFSMPSNDRVFRVYVEEM